ncbi:MAG: hypothetical protein J6Y17_03100 [Elusimicrobiaceae bacterium]|nr:hypothetical protein [Elusimicrobiaceae bacterium]
MNTKTNLRFLLSLGSTKVVVLQDGNSLHAYTNPLSTAARQKATVVPEHVAEALVEQ